MILSTGELVACVCIECFQPLASGYIAKQQRDAAVAAYCKHEFRTRIQSWGREIDFEQCMECRSSGIFWSLFDADTGEQLGVPYWSSYDKASAAASRYLGYGHRQIDLRRATA